MNNSSTSHPNDIMLRHALKNLRPNLLSGRPTHGTFAFTGRSAASSKAAVPSEHEIAAARKWVSNFDAETIPKSICEVDFSRSSGPGGQNVNKYASSHVQRRRNSEQISVPV